MSRLQVICEREHLKVDRETLEMMIESTGGDFRQILNQLQILLTLSSTSSSSIAGVLRSFSKDQLMGVTPFDAARALLVESKQPLQIRYDMFFSDYEMTPLIVEQNYLDSIKSNGMSIDVVEQMAEAADALCDMETLHETIVKTNVIIVEGYYVELVTITIDGSDDDSRRNEGYWKVCIPAVPNVCEYKGFIERMLGKYSTIRKNTRTVGELQSHINMNITGNRRAVVMDYFDMLNRYLLQPLTNDDVLTR